MSQHRLLQTYLEGWARDDSRRADISQTIQAIAGTAAQVAALIARGPLAGALHAVVGGNADGDAQKELDVRANHMFIEALRDAPVASFGSEENEQPFMLNGKRAPLAVSIDPLDGSSNIDTNVSIGTIFSILPMVSGPPEAAFLVPGTRQLAAGFVIYGPQTSLVLTVGDGTHVFTYDYDSQAFRLSRPDIRISGSKREYAINASNYHHWEEPLRAYIDDCIAGVESPEGEPFNMRWIASLVAEAFRILTRGGIFLYPRDSRPGYQNGRLRLLYEASPIAMLVEQAGGAATDGLNRILDIEPKEFHQRVPLVFGARERVERVSQYHQGRYFVADRSPLFSPRGLFRR